MNMNFFVISLFGLIIFGPAFNITSWFCGWTLVGKATSKLGRSSEKIILLVVSCSDLSNELSEFLSCDYNYISALYYLGVGILVDFILNGSYPLRNFLYEGKALWKRMTWS